MVAHGGRARAGRASVCSTPAGRQEADDGRGVPPRTPAKGRGSVRAGNPGLICYDNELRYSLVRPGLIPGPPEPPMQTDTKKLYIETVGCQMNVLDSELVVGSLRRQGYELTDDVDRRRHDPLQHLLRPPARRGQDLLRPRPARAATSSSNPDVVVGVLGLHGPEGPGADPPPGPARRHRRAAPASSPASPELIDAGPEGDRQAADRREPRPGTTASRTRSRPASRATTRSASRPCGRRRSRRSSAS